MSVVFRRDACGITCLVMTYAAVAYADYVVVRWVVLQTMGGSLWGALHVLLFNVVVFLLLMAHARAVFSDPGVVPLPQHRVDFSDAHSKGADPSDSSPPEEDWTICTRCEMYRPPRAHHCRICQRCVRKMDHHCPWINNCVGEWNQKYFIQFLLYVGVLSAYSVALVAASWYFPCPECPKDVHVSSVFSQSLTLIYIRLYTHSYPTTTGGMQNGSSVGICTRCKLASLAPICMLSR